MIVDLSRLNAAERTVLALLAAGHTIKSAAALTSSTENAVNERLREARRKTGVGSSRELARLVAGQIDAQESRDDFSGVATLVPISHHHDAPIGRVRRGWLIMGIIGTGIALALIAFIGQRAGTTPVAPRVVETVPATDAIVASGPLRIRVTFDQPMRANSFSFVTTDRGRYPDCERRPQQSIDGRTFTLACYAPQPGRYAMGFNGGRFQNFVAEQSGVPATPYPSGGCRLVGHVKDGS